MNIASSSAWRYFLAGGGALYIAGSSQHPRGAMVEMLVHPAWVGAHSAVFVALVLLTVSFVLLRRSAPVSAAVQRWLGFAILATGLEAVEMAVHTVAYVDAHSLAAGHSTPVLTVHIWLATLIYPIFAIAMIGLILAGQRERSLGSPWIAWIGISGAIAHGIVMPLMWGFPVAILFPIAAILLSAWFVLAGLWPVRWATRSGVGDSATADAPL